MCGPEKVWDVGCGLICVRCEQWACGQHMTILHDGWVCDKCDETRKVGQHLHQVEEKMKAAYRLIHEQQITIYNLTFQLDRLKTLRRTEQ